MMEAYQALLLGTLQGITEWLPISSQGQSMLFMIGWLGISPNDAFSYSILLHLGTMSAVLIRFKEELLKALRNPSSQMARVLIISAIGTGITGIPLYLLFREGFKGGTQATVLIGVLLVLTGLLLRFRGNGARSIQDMNAVDMIILGLVQGFSILPGISRSGTTLTVLLMRNLKQDDALVISFMISVPAVMGALALDHSLFLTEMPLTSAALAILASFVAGYLTMDLLIAYAEKVNFSPFCITLGLLTLLLVVIF
ncbi:MAG: undecaprenyl-diphosphate phosphatase [Methanothrix sp.]|nr:undecaprenyl-diphosphate phosphatase [Methanothrix sp.]